MEFQIKLRSFRDVQEFIQIATVQPFRVWVGNENQKANATSFMGLVSLDHRRPLWVRADCDPDAFLRFRRDAARFAAE